MDWQRYKKEEGLEEELTQHSKDGWASHTLSPSLPLSLSLSPSPSLSLCDVTLYFLSHSYLAKQEFLQRADLKQFELERDERLKRFRKMH